MIDAPDTCGLCGQPILDADESKYHHPIHWPGERVPDSPIVHVECEMEECERAHAALSDQQREAFLKSL